MVNSMTTPINEILKKIEYPVHEDYHNNKVNYLNNLFNNHNNINDEESKYYMIYDYILSEIIPKYDEIYSCDMFHEDEDGYPCIRYYLRYDMKLTFEEREKIHHEILVELYDYSKKQNITREFMKTTIFMVERRE